MRLICFPHFSNVVRERVVRVGRREQRLDRQQHRPDLQRRAPLVLEDVKADAAQFVNVGVVDLGEEAHLGWRHRIVLRQEELQFEDAAWSRMQRGKARGVRFLAARDQASSLAGESASYVYV